MTELIRALAVRVFTGGIICSAAMILAGDGAKKEIVRLCCACLMVVLVVSPLKGVSLNFSALTSEANSAEARINQALEQSREYERNAVAAAVARFIRESALGIGIECEVSVEHYTDEQNVFHITGVQVTAGGIGESERERVRQIIVQNCGLSAGQITFVEAAEHEN